LRCRKRSAPRRESVGVKLHLCWESPEYLWRWRVAEHPHRRSEGWRICRHTIRRHVVSLRSVRKKSLTSACRRSLYSTKKTPKQQAYNLQEAAGAAGAAEVAEAAEAAEVAHEAAEVGEAAEAAEVVAAAAVCRGELAAFVRLGTRFPLMDSGTVGCPTRPLAFCLLRCTRQPSPTAFTPARRRRCQKQPWSATSPTIWPSRRQTIHQAPPLRC
jgi:hypothetical protein